MNSIRTNIRFIPLRILAGVQRFKPECIHVDGFIPLTILVGVQRHFGIHGAMTVLYP